MVDLLNSKLPDGWEASERHGVWLSYKGQTCACNWNRHVVWFQPAGTEKVESAIVCATQTKGRGWFNSMANAFLAIAEDRVDQHGRPVPNAS